MKFKAAFYMRLSREEGDKIESESIINQKRLLANFYEKNSEQFLEFEEYVDDGYSGINFKRPAFRRLLEDIENRKINCVIVKDLSRLGRDYIETGFYLDKFFAEYEIRFISINDHIDNMNGEYEAIVPIKNVMNQEYSKDISRKVRAAYKTMQQRGEFIGSFASYGYKKDSKDKHKLAIDEYPASIVRRIYDMYVSGCSKKQIARILNDEGILCPSEYKTRTSTYVQTRKVGDVRGWSYNTVANILSKEIYVGNMVQNTAGVTKIRGKQKKRNPEESIIVEDTHEPIIDKKTFKIAQKLNSKNKRPRDVSINGISPLAGFVRCKNCKKAMVKHRAYVTASGEKKHYYSCATYKRYGNSLCTKHSIRYDIIESVVLADLNSYLSRIGDISQLINIESVMKCKENKNINDTEKLEHELNRIKRLKFETYNDLKNKLISEEEYIFFRQSYMEQSVLLEQQIEYLKKKNIEKEIELDSWVKELIEEKCIKSLDKSLVSEFIHCIYVGDENELTIQYNFVDKIET